jgi:hypothetical protein
MGILDLTFRTISCNAMDCNKTITYDRNEEKKTFDNLDNVWLKSFRQVTTLDQRVLGYCSDLCEISGVGTGTHNLPEPKKIISEPASAAQIQAAANAAKQAEAATAAMKSGQPVTLS